MILKAKSFWSKIMKNRANHATYPRIMKNNESMLNGTYKNEDSIVNAGYFTDLLSFFREKTLRSVKIEDLKL